jgi:serine/threonine protein kinase
MAPQTDDIHPAPAVGAGTRPAESSRTSPPRVGRVGQRVGPFQLVERLARHNAIGLYRATRPAGSRQPREVAIRIVEDARNDHAAAWVRHEYDILVRLDHPAIPRAFGYYSSQVGVALSLPPAITLDMVLLARQDGRLELDVPTSLDLLHEVADALRHAHGVAGPDGPVCHGHLHPANIGLNPDGSVVLLGFGAAPLEQPVSYSPPEQVAGAFTDARSDQWRLGALLVELLLGTPLYSDLDDPETAAAEGMVQPWVQRLERRYPEAARIAAKLLAPAAGSRYDHDNTVVRDFLELARHQGGRPDRRALVSQMRAILEAEARREAELRRAAEPEAPTVVAEPKPPEPDNFQPAPQLPDEPDPPETDGPTEDAEPEPAIPLSPEAPEAAEDDDSLELDAAHAPSIGTILGGGDPTELPGAAPAPSLALVADVADIANVPDPASIPEPVAVAYEEEDEDDYSSEAMSLGLGRVQSPLSDGPSLGPIAAIAEDPTLGEPWGGVDGSDPTLEVTEVVDRDAHDIPAPPPAPTGPRPAKWFPSELAAMAAIGVALIVAIVFIAWRFG